MGWPPSNQLTIRALATGSEQKTGTIEAVQLLGAGKLDFTRDGEGLHVQRPAQKPGLHAYTLKLSGVDLV